MNQSLNVDVTGARDSDRAEMLAFAISSAQEYADEIGEERLLLKTIEWTDLNETRIRLRATFAPREYVVWMEREVD